MLAWPQPGTVSERSRMRARSAIFRLCTGRPFNVYVPPVGESSRPRMASSVDFPQPDGPIIATNSPGCTVTLTSSNA